VKQEKLRAALEQALVGQLEVRIKGEQFVVQGRDW